MSKTILVTGPPLNNRDEYINKALNTTNNTEIGYYHIFSEMQKISQDFGIPDLNRKNVLDSLSEDKLSRLRDETIKKVADDINLSQENINIISSPALFYNKSQPGGSRGNIPGLEKRHIKILKPDMVIIFIADLLKVKQNLKQDKLWSKRTNSNLKNLLEWREDSIELVREFENSLLADGSYINKIIFAEGHNYNTFLDLVRCEKPVIYLSFAITNASPSDLEKIDEIKTELSRNFVCINPYSIKDWNIIKEYDNAVAKGDNQVSFSDYYDFIDFNEINDAMHKIRIRTVERDHSLIELCCATVVLHITKHPSYGVMSEVIHTRKHSDNVSYVLYPFKKRSSPFFESYIKDHDRIISGDRNINELTTDLIDKMKRDIESGLWTRWPS